MGHIAHPATSAKIPSSCPSLVCNPTGSYVVPHADQDWGLAVCDSSANLWGTYASAQAGLAVWEYRSKIETGSPMVPTSPQDWLSHKISYLRDGPCIAETRDLSSNLKIQWNSPKSSETHTSVRHVNSLPRTHYWHFHGGDVNHWCSILVRSL